MFKNFSVFEQKSFISSGKFSTDLSKLHFNCREEALGKKYVFEKKFILLGCFYELSVKTFQIFSKNFWAGLPRKNFMCVEKYFGLKKIREKVQQELAFQREKLKLTDRKNNSPVVYYTSQRKNFICWLWHFSAVLVWAVCLTCSGVCK